MTVIISEVNIWSAPSRSIKVEYETRNRTLSSVQVRFKFTYKMTGVGGYSGYSQYATPTIAGSAYSRTTLKENSPTSWDTIEKTTDWYTVSASWEKTSLSVSFSFTSTDPADSTVTKTGTISFSAYAAVSTFTLSGGGTTSAGNPYVNVNGSNGLSISISRYSTSFTHTVEFLYGSTVIATHTNKATSDSYTLPMDAWLNRLTNAKNTTGLSAAAAPSVRVTTKSGSTTIGSTSKRFDIYVPDIAEVKPTLSMTLSKVSSLPSPFNSQWVQGYTKVRASFSASGEYGASISSYQLTVDGSSYSGNPATSNELSTSGEVVVKGKVTDSRGYSTEVNESITVLQYSPPAVIPYHTENEVIVSRCDSAGNLRSDGTYLRIRLGQRYSALEGNTCSVSYRYRKNSASFSGWTAITLTSNEADLILPSIVTDTTANYYFEIRATDLITDSSVIKKFVSSDDCTFSLADGGKRMGLGGYSTKGDEVVDCRWDMNIEKTLNVVGASYGIIPSGAITAYCGISMPDGWLECNGQAVSRTTYANLFAVIGTTYGIGDGSTSFNVPDIRGRMIVGQNTSDADFDVLGETGGAKTHTHTTGNHKLTTSEIPAHRHNVEEANSTSFVITNSRTHTSSGTYMTQLTKTGTYTASATAAYRLQTDNSGGSGGNHNHGDTGSASELSPYIVERYIIKA